MAFWSSQTLREKLPSIITDSYDESAIEQASYTLKIGKEIFLTKELDNSNNSRPRKIILSELQDFVIPPGQFAFLLTEEVISVPSNAIAFISMKARYKHKGLVNISGFHVDPGFNGHLLFTVYNAGPTPIHLIHLNHKLPFFLIWFSDLDKPDDAPRASVSVPTNINIPIEVLNQISTDEIYSLQALTKEFRAVDSKVNGKLEELCSVYTEIKFTKTVIFTFIGIVVSALIYLSSSIISIGKFAIEQRDVVSNLSEYKAVLDELVEKRKNAKNN